MRVSTAELVAPVAEIEKREGVEFSDIAELVSGERGFKVLETGDMEYGIWWSGMSQGLIYDIPTVEELISRMVAEAESIIHERLVGLSK